MPTRFTRNFLIILLFLSGLLIGITLINGERDTHLERTPLIVSAAVSLQPSMELLEKSFEAEYPRIDLILNFGSSGTLQRQIEQGAPADLFLSAGRLQMQALMDEQLVESSKIIALNELVVVVPYDRTQKWHEMDELNKDDIKRIAIGQPDTVPAGEYAKESLISYGQWDHVQRKLIFAKDVRQVLTYVETGNADAGFVYRSDVNVEGKARIAFTIPSDKHPPIEYPAAILTQTGFLSEARLFYDYLSSETALLTFKQQGLIQP